MATAKTTKSAAQTQPYIVATDTLQHDGELCAAGDQIELTPAQAAPLIALGDIKEPPAKAA